MKQMRKWAGMIALVMMLALLGGIQTGAATQRQGQRFDFDQSRGRTVADAVILLREIDRHGDGIITETQGDVNGDGSLTLFDAIVFMRLLLNDTYKEEQALKIVTYNIKCGWYSQTLNLIGESIINMGADIVGLQEVDSKTTRSGTSIVQATYLEEYLEKKTGETWYSSFTPVIYLDGTRARVTNSAERNNVYGHAVLSRYPIQNSVALWPKTQTAGEEPRAISRNEIVIGKKILALYNGHLDFTQGRYQYQEIQDNYMANDQYAIFVGDMNETIKELRNSGCVNEDRFEILTDDSKIDHIIVSNDTIGWYADETGTTGFTVSSTLKEPVIIGGKEYTTISDHDAMWSKIMLKDA